jgi:hypothetical protein
MAVFGLLVLLVVGMAVQYALYMRAERRGRRWHPPRKPKKPFWL